MGSGREVSIHAPRATLINLRHRAELAVSIHAPRAGRDRFRGMDSSRSSVSTHAPRAGRDVTCRTAGSGGCCFNPRAPRGARPRRCQRPRDRLEFQSTRPARGATRRGPRNRCASSFNPRAPRGARRKPATPRAAMRCFNPRAPRGARLGILAIASAILVFQSTRPARGATRSAQPAAPGMRFQSTRPARGATRRSC